MKWAIKQKPNMGGVRYVRRFAWLPTEVQGYMIWLEFYCERQVYVPYKWLTDYRWKWSRSPAP